MSPEHPSFHVVAMSLPGYGFSQAPSKKGFRIAQYAEVGHKLMLALGYNEYGEMTVDLLRLETKRNHESVTQGGDWGSLVSFFSSSQYASNQSR